VKFCADSMFVTQTRICHAADVWKEHVTLFKSIYDRALLREEALYTSHFVQIVGDIGLFLCMFCGKCVCLEGEYIAQLTWKEDVALFSLHMIGLFCGKRPFIGLIL